jgi:hypothetical protein
MNTTPRLYLGDKVAWTVRNRSGGTLKLLYHWGTINHLATKTVQIHCEDGKNRKFSREVVIQWLTHK